MKLTLRNKILLFCLALWVACFSVIPTVHATINNPLTNRSLLLADSTISTTTSYTLSFDTPILYTIGSIALEFCEESPIPNDLPCTKPSNMNAASATLDSQTGIAGFSINANTTANRIVIGRVPGNHGAGPLKFVFGNVTNPDTVRTYYARIYIYPSNDGTGAETENAGLAYAINKSLSITSEVPPNLLFCVGQSIPQYDCGTAVGSFLDFGELSTTAPKLTQHQMLVATNAGFGFSVTVTGQTLTSGNNTIPPLNTPTASLPGTSQFGLNLRQNTSPSFGQDPVGPGVGVVIAANYNIPNRFTFNNGDIVYSSSNTTDYYKVTATFLTNISKNQRPGVYNTTILYICLANF